MVHSQLSMLVRISCTQSELATLAENVIKSKVNNSLSLAETMGGFAST